MPSIYFEDFPPGRVFELGSVTVTREAIIEFATRFDPQPFHTDERAAAESAFGGLIASGWHTGSVLMKLLSSTLGEASLGSPGGDDLRWLAPVRPGDELRLRVTVESARPSSSKPDRGVLVYRNELFNQHDEVVMTFTSTMFMRRRPGGQR